MRKFVNALQHKGLANRLVVTLSLGMGLFLLSCLEGEDNTPESIVEAEANEQAEAEQNDGSDNQNTEEASTEPVEQREVAEELNCEAKTLDEVKQDVLTTFADQVAGRTYESFAEATKELLAATEQWASTQKDEDRTAAQDAWVSAMTLWQHAEVFQVGPAAASSASDHGMDFRDYINSYPSTNPCWVDQETVGDKYKDLEAFKSEKINKMGLDVLDKLLFTDATGNECGKKYSINENGTWDSFGDAGIVQARADYSVTLSKILVDKADELLNAWRDDFAPLLVAPGGDNEHFENLQASLNTVSDSLFYMDKLVKDAKLAIPLGIKDCPEATCPDEEEVPFSGLSLTMVRENMVGFKMVMMGVSADEVTCDTAGWVDLLVALGSEDMANSIIADIDASIAAIDALESTSVSELLESDYDGLETVYTNIQRLTTTLKGEFLTTLNLQIPQSAATDND